MHEKFQFPMDVAEDNTAQQEKFVNRFPMASEAIREAMKTELSKEEFVTVVERFNQSQPELSGSYSKDYLKLDNGRQIGLYWDEQNNVRLGHSLEDEAFAPEQSS